MKWNNARLNSVTVWIAIVGVLGLALFSPCIPDVVAHPWGEFERWHYAVTPFFVDDLLVLRDPVEQKTIITAAVAWSLLALLVLRAVWCVTTFLRAGWRAARGRCRSCAYSLRASPECCPECGRAVVRRLTLRAPLVAAALSFIVLVGLNAAGVCLAHSSFRGWRIQLVYEGEIRRLETEQLHWLVLTYDAHAIVPGTARAMMAGSIPMDAEEPIEFRAQIYAGWPVRWYENATDIDEVPAVPRTEDPPEDLGCVLHASAYQDDVTILWANLAKCIATIVVLSMIVGANVLTTRGRTVSVQD